ncbi:dihydroorotate dehydrogenase, partial [bacterium F11]
PEGYLEEIRKAKEAVSIPIIGSLNGHSLGGWTDYAKKIEQAGADALELNIYFIPTDGQMSSQQVEDTYIDILKAVRSAVKIPIAVKISPFFSSMANMARRFDEAGADALVLFNRFYQPDIDLENLEVIPNVILSMPMAMRVPLRWVAILHNKIKANLAATGGIHHGRDVLKMIMAGADVTMLCSTLYKNGMGYVQTILKDMSDWMQKKEYESLQQMKGSMSQKSVENPMAFERANYMRAITSGVTNF